MTAQLPRTLCSTTLTFFLYSLKQTKTIPVGRLLHLLFPLPVMFFLWIVPRFPCTSFRSLFKCFILLRAFKNSTSHHSSSWMLLYFSSWYHHYLHFTTYIFVDFYALSLAFLPSWNVNSGKTETLYDLLPVVSSAPRTCLAHGRPSIRIH